MQLEIEQVAVGKDDTAAERREEIERELAELREQAAGMRAQWEREKEQAEGHGKLRERLDEARVELERAERELDYQRAAELRHGEIPELEQRLAEAESREAEATRAAGLPVRASVDADEIAEVVGKWTGIPVTPPDGGRGREARPHGGAPAPARHRPGRGGRRPSPTRCAAHAPA